MKNLLPCARCWERGGVCPVPACPTPAPVQPLLLVQPLVLVLVLVLPVDTSAPESRLSSEPYFPRCLDLFEDKSRMGVYEEKKETCGTICLKYLLITFNFLFWLAGGVVMAVGIWTLLEKSDYISLLPSKTYAASAYILVLAGAIVMVTGVLGCCATFKEQRRLLRVYFVLLLCIFLLEVLAGVLAYIYYQQLNEELKLSLRDTMIQKYQKSNQEHVTRAVDKLQQEFKCCGSNSSSDWAASEWIRSQAGQGRLVPDSCCKTPTPMCGERDHPSNIYKVEGGCITKLERFILEHLKIIGAVGVGIACVQVIGMVFTCCLYKSLKVEPY